MLKLKPKTKFHFIAVSPIAAVLLILFCLLSRQLFSIDIYFYRFVNAGIDLAGATVMCILLISSILSSSERSAQRYFMWMLCLVAAALLLDGISWLIDGYEKYVTQNIICNILLYFLYVLVVWLYTKYLQEYTDSQNGVFAGINLAVDLLMIALILCILLLALFGQLFRIENFYYVRSPGSLLALLSPLSMIIIDVFMIFLAHATPWREKAALLSFCLLPTAGIIIQYNQYGFSLLIILSALSMTIMHANVYARQNYRLLSVEKELTDAHVQGMLSQIQPHFLYNSITSIIVLCDENPKEASAALTDFAAYLRGNLESIRFEKAIPFKKEVEHLQAYLRLEKLRYQEKLEVVFDLKVTDFAVPSLTIQPLVENAVKHGVGQRIDGGTVKISSWEDRRSFYIMVEDNGVGFVPGISATDGNSHVGVENVQKRLQSICEGTLHIESTPDVGTKVTVIIPKGGLR